MSYHRKYVETNTALAEPQKITYACTEEPAEIKTPPLNWFWFYKNITLLGASISTLVAIIAYLGEISQIENFMRDFFYINIGILFFLVVSLSAYIYLLINLRKFKPFAYKLNMVILITSVIFVSNEDYYSYQQVAIRYTLVALFIILNIIYFEKRRHLFIQNCDKTKRNKRIIAFSAVAVILAALTFFYLYPMNNRPTAQDQTDYNIEIAHNMDELAALYNYDSKYAMIDDIENQYGTPISSYSFGEAFEFISTNCLGLESYEAMEGKRDENGYKIKTFTDYQEYVLNYVGDLPGYEALY